MKNYLKSLGINEVQEEALFQVCENMFMKQLEEDPIIYIDDEEIAVCHPFLDYTGRKFVDPIAEYKDKFINSKFVEMAKEMNLDEKSSKEDIEKEIQRIIEKYYN